ncbi:hypothetical protein OAU77_01615 [Gammaproteobacteria bacterium]|nr:hypothetical protein [Gammaproteobacteria bacterium]
MCRHQKFRIKGAAHLCGGVLRGLAERLAGQFLMQHTDVPEVINE